MSLSVCACIGEYKVVLIVIIIATTTTATICPYMSLRPMMIIIIIPTHNDEITKFVCFACNHKQNSANQHTQTHMNHRSLVWMWMWDDICIWNFNEEFYMLVRHGINFSRHTHTDTVDDLLPTVRGCRENFRFVSVVIHSLRVGVCEHWTMYVLHKIWSENVWIVVWLLLESLTKLHQNFSLFE